MGYPNFQTLPINKFKNQQLPPNYDEWYYSSY
jgi:hypothetical protein